MASLMESLMEVLENESSEYKNLLGLAMKKTPVIISGDLEELAKITDEEQSVVGRINRLEQKRQESFSDIANVINKDVNRLKISDLITMLDQRPEEQQKLSKIHDKLKENVYAVKGVNERNRELIQSVLEMVEFDMNVLQSAKTAPETANYNKGAFNTGDHMGVPNGGFDAKQ